MSDPLKIYLVILIAPHVLLLIYVIIKTIIFFFIYKPEEKMSLSWPVIKTKKIYDWLLYLGDDDIITEFLFLLMGLYVLSLFYFTIYLLLQII